MKPKIRQELNKYIQSVAKDNQLDFNGVAQGQKFAVEPSVQQRLENAVQESSAFLKMINVVPVVEKQGEVLGLGVTGTIASTTDTSGGAERKTQDIHQLNKNSYNCEKINYDTHINYSTLDLWSKFPDFAKRIGVLKAERIALDRIMIGFNGEQRADNSNRLTNPLLQDVAKGWLKKIEENASARCMSQVGSTGKIEVGKDKAYKNLDALVFSAVTDLIATQYQEDTKLVAILSRDLLADKYFPLYNQEKPSEQVAGDLVISQKRLGGLQAVRAPFMPRGTILITRLDNLSIYYQEGGMRRAIIDNARLDRIEDFCSSNEDFVIENYDMVALLKNIEVADSPEAS